MSEIHEKLTRCFANVFPNLPRDEIPRASTTSLAAWDSLAHVTLLSAVAEEFGQEFELDDYEALVSYSLIVDHLENRAANG
jgi:acyl carrier protein